MRSGRSLLDWIQEYQASHLPSQQNEVGLHQSFSTPVHLTYPYEAMTQLVGESLFFLNRCRVVVPQLLLEPRDGCIVVDPCRLHRLRQQSVDALRKQHLHRSAVPKDLSIKHGGFGDFVLLHQLLQHLAEKPLTLREELGG